MVTDLQQCHFTAEWFTTWLAVRWLDSCDALRGPLRVQDQHFPESKDGFSSSRVTHTRRGRRQVRRGIPHKATSFRRLDDSADFFIPLSFLLGSWAQRDHRICYFWLTAADGSLACSNPALSFSPEGSGDTSLSALSLIETEISSSDQVAGRTR